MTSKKIFLNNSIEIRVFSAIECLQNRDRSQTLERVRFIQAHRSELFGVFARRLAHQMVNRRKRNFIDFQFLI